MYIAFIFFIGNLLKWKSFYYFNTFDDVTTKLQMVTKEKGRLKVSIPKRMLSISNGTYSKTAIR